MTSISDAWEEHAASWIRWARAPGHDAFWTWTWPRLSGALPPPRGITIDVGAGEGRASRLLHDAGYDVVALDRSPTLARAAASAGTPRPVRGDAARLPFRDGSVALAVACMTFQDFDDLDAATGEIGRVLERGGVLCASFVHPFASARDLNGSSRGPAIIPEPYLVERRYEDHVERDGITMTFVSVHRPLSAYIAAITSAGLVVTGFEEHGDTTIPWLAVVTARRS